MDYHIEPADAPYIRRILEGYVFDRNQQTHCCELTPSYYLLYLFTSVELTDAGLALDDDARGTLYDRYEAESSDDCYVHCSDVERLLAPAALLTVNHYGDTQPYQQEEDVNDPEARHDAELENIREYLRCNHPFDRATKPL
jgi:hypothetical protein